MTDKEKLDKLVAEIERRKKMNILNENKYEEDIDLLSFYNSMQEEPTRKCKGCNNVKGCITCVDGSEYAHIEECDITGIKSKEATGKLKELVDNVSEEGLEEARKQLQELVNGGLDEEINRYIEQHNSEFSGYFFNLRRIAWHFANWQAQKMMKKAISAKVTEIYYPTDSCLEIEATLPEGRFKDGDKVLIIKED